MAELVLRPYATALFDIALEQDKTKEFASQVKMIISSIEQNTEFMDILLHPKIMVEEKLELIDKVFKGRVSDEITGTLSIIVRKGRQDMLLNIMELFLEMVNEHLGIVQATVTSAVELNKEQLAQIKSNIEKKTNKTVEIQTNVDKTIIGGMIIRVGDSVFDASVSGRLEKLKEGLVNLRLA